MFYVVTDPVAARVKFGVTSGDPRPRLGDHARNGYTSVRLLATEQPDAAELERAVLRALSDAEVRPVMGREYFDVSALALVVDVAQGWIGSLAIAS